MPKTETVARGWFGIGERKSMEVRLDSRGKLHYEGDGPAEWINTVLDEYGDHLVYTGLGPEPLLPVRPATFSQFLHAVVNLANANTDAGWRYHIEEERIQDWAEPDPVTDEIPRF